MVYKNIFYLYIIFNKIVKRITRYEEYSITEYTF